MHGHADRKRQYPHVHLDDDFAGERKLRQHQLDAVHRRVADDDPQHAAAEREDDILGEELPDQPPPAGAERRAHDHFPLAGHTASESQVGEVGAADQEHEAGGRHQHQQARAHIGPDERARVVLHDHAPTLVRCREVLCDAGANHVHAGLRLSDRHAVLQTGERGQPVEVPRHVRGLERQRAPDLGGRAVEGAALGQDADDCVGLSVELHDPVHDAGVGPELTGPQRVTEDGDLVLAELILVGQERAAEGRRDAEDLEIARRHPGAAQLDRRLAAGHGDVATGLGRHEVEDGVVLLPVEKVQGRDSVPLPLRRLLEHPHDPLGLFVGQRLQENPVHEAENGDVGTHTDGQRQHCNRGKPAAVLQGACGVAQILTEGHRSASWGRS